MSLLPLEASVWAATLYSEWQKGFWYSLFTSPLVGKTQKEKIYQSLKDIDVFGYPEDFEPPTSTLVLPSSDFYLEVEINGVSKKINWEQNVYSSTKRAKRLRRVFDLLDDMLDASAAIQALPKDERMFF